MKFVTTFLTGIIIVLLVVLALKINENNVLKAKIVALDDGLKISRAQIDAMAPATAPVQYNHGVPRANISSAVAQRSELAVNSAKHSKFQRDTFTDHEVENLYGTALKTLGLSEDSSVRLKGLLSERFRSVDDAREIMKKGPLLKPEEFRALTGKIEGEIDDEIRNLIGEDKFAQLSRLMAIPGYLGQVQNSFSPRFDSAGCPITPEQSVQLAEALSESTSGAGDLVGSDGLNSSDHSVFQKMSATLSVKQRSVLLDELTLRRQMRTQATTPRGN